MRHQYFCVKFARNPKCMFQSKFSILSIFTVVLLLHVCAGIFFNGYSFWWLPGILMAYFILLILGSIFIRWNFYIKSQNKLPRLRLHFNQKGFAMSQQDKSMALSFDDGPSEHTTVILDILKREKIPATFFLIGRQIEGKEEIVKRMAKEGHEIGGHSFSHSKNFDWKSSKEMLSEILTTNETIEAITQNPIRLFRPPYGVTNPNLAKAIRLSGMKSVGWNIRSLDTTAKSEEKLLKRMLKRVKPGTILLLHGHCQITQKILPKLITGIREKGYVFERL